ncbi:LytR family transcriptional regulator [candidate division WWE3 bacterium]|jgi:LCP family protein required for cell wall assembly|uniref:LytR family transcriptional regulator n=1 Tax=candidate division WWE3 bacterium TaxID=2053526 RepID=A0A3A4ZCL5_UNCKA|nr:MAG: LytR family transcriptional regulator [candidate division WWE3 bacterium]
MKYTDVKVTNDRKGKKKGATGLVVFFIGVVVLGGMFLLLRGPLSKGLDPISIVASVSAADIKETDGRTNVLLLGSDKRKAGVVTSELTDTILVASIGHVDRDLVLISIPRDLWVQSPAGYHSKVNEIYTYGGAQEISKVVEQVLDIPIHYHAVVTFELFREAVDVLGGIEVTVERAFTDRFYPVEGMENAPENERYEVVSFQAGKQTMDGDTALKYARSRKGDNDEGTDFARSRRQQKVIMAIKDKALSLKTLINPMKIKELYDIYSNSIDTNIDINTVQSFYLLSQKINFEKVNAIVLDDRSEANDGGLLYAPEDTSLYGGRYVLIPRTGDYSQIHAYVQKYVFGDK